MPAGFTDDGAAVGFELIGFYTIQDHARWLTAGV